MVVNCVSKWSYFYPPLYIYHGVCFISALKKRVLGKIKGKELMRGIRRVGWVKMATRKRHRLTLEDFQNMATACESTEGRIADNLLTIEEAAELLHVKPSTVWFWVCGKKPSVPHFREGSVVRFKREWLAEWARKREEALKKWNFEL